MRRVWLLALLVACACGPAPSSTEIDQAVAPSPGAMAAPTASPSQTPLTSEAPSARQMPSSPPPDPTAPGSAAPSEPKSPPMLSVQAWCTEVGRAGAGTRCIAPSSEHPDAPRVRIAFDDAIADDRTSSAIGAQIVDDIEAVQAEFQRTITTSPVIDVYASTERYASGLSEVFGYSRATSDYLAENSVAFFEPSLRRLAVNWEAVSDRKPIAAIRHELTHLVTLEACAPRCDLVPAWFNEGEARLMEALIPGADWRMMRVRYEAASMVATDTLLPLTALWTQNQWNAYGDWAGYYKYQEAARTTDLIRADVGEHAIARIYARIRAGEDLPTAYQRLSGKTWSSFVASLPARLSADIPPGPAISLVEPSADGTGASYLLYGFPAEAKVTLHVKARYFDESSEVGVSPQGAYFGSIDASYPPGTYTITAASGSVLAAVTVVKRGGRPVRASD